MTDIIKICSYCNEVIEPDAPAMQTRSVDMGLLTGYNHPKAVASNLWTYHVEPDCYRLMLRDKQAGTERVATARSDKAVSEEVQEWSATFGMTPEETLSGRRGRYSRYV